MVAYLIVCPLVFLAGLVDAIAGGGGLISLPAYLLAGVPVHTALATNKLSSTMGTVVSTGRYLRGGFVDLKFALPAAALSLAGSVVGANLALLADEVVLTRLLLVVLPVVAFYVVRNKHMGEGDRTNTLPRRTMFLITLGAALVFGVYDGFYGPGTGTFLLLVLTGLARMDLRTAAGTTKVLNLSSNVAALLTFILSGKVFYPLGLTAGVFCILGHYLGAGMVTQNGHKVVRPVILLVVGLLFIKLIAGF